MIDYLYVNNYRSLVNFRIDFNKTSVLVGKNGTGKTSVIQVLHHIQQFIAFGMRAGDVFERNSLTKWMDSNIQTFELGMSRGDRTYTYKLEIEFERTTEVVFARFESVSMDGKVYMESWNGAVALYNDEQKQAKVFQTDPALSGLNFGTNTPDTMQITDFKQLLLELIVLKMDPAGIMDRAETESAIPDYRFHNLVAVFAFLMQVHPEAINKTWERMREIDNTFNAARVVMDTYGKKMLVDYRYNDVHQSYVLSELSEGERMLLALYVLLFGYIEQGFTVVIDEPDNYVSLREIQPWCSAVRMACEEKGQSILISHHPEVIDYLAGDSGIWMSRLASGESVIRGNPTAGITQDGFMRYSEMIAGGYLDEA